MNETIQLLESIKKFNDASFVSFGVDGKSVIVQNEATGDLYSFPIQFDENLKTYTLSGKDAVLLSEEEAEKPSLKEACLNFFSEGEGEIEGILEACASKKMKEKKSYKLATKLESIFSDEVVTAFQKFEESMNQFIGECDLFDESNKPVEKETIYHPDFLLEMKEWKESKREALLESIDIYTDFLDKSKEVLSEKQIEIATEKLFEGIDVIAGKSFFGLLTKNLTKIKKESGLDFSVESVVMELDKLREETFSETFEEGFRATLDAPDAYGQLSNTSVQNYLKFKVGTFNKTTVGRLLEDFDNVLTKYHEMNQEELVWVSKLRDIVTFMYRTEQYDDEMIWNIIREFNNKFSTMNKMEPVSA